jgi:predicted nuclease with TOPRIM domain
MAIHQELEGSQSASRQKLKQDLDAERQQVNEHIKALDSERDVMEEMMSQAAVEMVDLIGTWRKSNVNQKQELAKALFPEGLVSAIKMHSLNRLTSCSSICLRRAWSRSLTLASPTGFEPVLSP